MGKPPTGYQIEAAMSQAQQFVAGLAEDITGDHEALMMALDTETPVFDLLSAVVRASLEADAAADGCAERMAVLTERKGRFKTRHENLRRLALSMMGALDLNKWEFPEFTLSVSAARSRLVVTDIDALPDDLVRVTRAPDMMAIKEAAKDGPVPGTESTNGAPGLTVRVR